MSSVRPSGVRFALHDWMRPPRPHGQTVEGRTVSFLELFFDLVFVVFVSQVAHILVTHPNRHGAASFVVLFTLVWYTWLNGTLYHDLHGSDDGRSRIYMFVQMAFIAMLAVSVGSAAYDLDSGRRFAILLCLLLLWLTYQWWVVRRQDDAAMAAVSTPYFVGLGAMFTMVLASVAASDPSTRLALWAVGAAVAIAVPLLGSAWRQRGRADGFAVSESMAERFALFTIIVLGEVVVGVVGGLSEAGSSWVSIVVGLLCLNIGFGIWWNYFDFVGSRKPRPGRGIRGVWLVVHLPLSLSIAATGAGMVSLIEHASEDRTPAATAWLLGGSVALLCLSLAVIVSLMPPRAGVRLVPATLALAGVGALTAAAAHPRPWLLAALLIGLLSAVWTESFVRHARLGEAFVEDAAGT